MVFAAGAPSIQFTVSVSYRHPERHRLSMSFAMRALLAGHRGVPVPPPRSPTEPAFGPGLVVLLLLVPPVRLFVWWQRYRRR
jgi:hypothetical protein